MLSIAAALGLTCVVGSQVFPGGAPCWEADYGVPLNLGDDDVVAVPVGFTFPRPGAGGTTDAVAVCSNGFVWLDPTQTDSTWFPSVTQLLQMPPRIAVAWTDLDPSSVGGVYVHRFVNRFVVTWSTATYSFQRPTRVQLQIYPDGSFSIYHLRTSNEVPDQVGPLVGVSRGLGAPDPGEIDLSAIPSPSAFGPNVYELFDPNGNDWRDLRGVGLLFTRNPTHGGFTVSRPGCSVWPYARHVRIGQPCPSATQAMLWEHFDDPISDPTDVVNRSLRYRATGQGLVVEWQSGFLWDGTYGPVLPLTDDELSSPQSLGFATSYFGINTSGIEVCSNGFVNLVTGVDPIPWLGPNEFPGAPPRVALLMADHDPSAGGSIHYRTVGGPDPYALVTFQGVPRFAEPWLTTTAQARFLGNGDIVVSYGGNLSPTGVIGITRGEVVPPTEVDVTAVLPRSLSGQVIPPLQHQGFPWPAIGQTFELAAFDLAPGTLAAVAHVGVLPQEIDLNFLGMSGCFGYALPDLGTLPMSINGSEAVAPLPIPLLPNLVGGRVYTQAFELSPGVNDLGLGASNRLDLHLGF
jgi:hypothetical protein